jgi:hypothetical protein
VGIDAEKIRYRPVAEIDDASAKAIALAGAIPVAVV